MLSCSLLNCLEGRKVFSGNMFSGGRTMLLEVKNISKSFGGIHALDSCSFDVNEGEILGLIGPNGSGKSTMFNVMTGVYISDTGSIKYKGEDVTKWSSDRRARFGL